MSRIVEEIGPSRREFLRLAGFSAVSALLGASGRLSGETRRPHERPNIIFIMADDLGYGDLGCYGQQKMRTPRIDQMAREGIRFTDCHAGSTVCSPSRSVLMTGQHTGHTRIRGNMCTAGGITDDHGRRRMHLTEEDITVGHVLGRAGYRTGLVGKWHLDGYNPDAGPLDRGFDEFYGWLINDWNTHQPTYFPTQRWHNRTLLDVEENRDGRNGYHHADMCLDEATAFLKNNKDRPFFLYLSYNLPHDPLVEPPGRNPYAETDWPEPMKIYAAMVDYMDMVTGKVLELLKELELDEKTIVFFCSDNGARSRPTQELTDVAEFFQSSGPLRGYKRDMYEGGTRVPMIVRWPGRIPPGKTSDALWYFADFLPTAAELAGAEPPDNIDGISVLDAIQGKPQDTADRFLYWEFHERGFQQAARRRHYKAIRPALGSPLELYDLSRDVGETNNIADQHPDIIGRLEAYLKTARTDSPNWPITR